jgi:predicted metalloendopeptidase
VPLQNIESFYKAFSIKEGDNMFIAPDKRVKIW